MDGSSGKGGMVAKLGASFFADPASMGTTKILRSLLFHLAQTLRYLRRCPVSASTARPRGTPNAVPPHIRR